VNVILAYSVTQARVIVVDLMSSTGAATWYGKGVANVQPGSGTTTVTINIEGNPPIGPNYMFHAWVVSTGDFNGRGDPWNYALSSTNVNVNIVGSGGIAMFSEDVSPCEDNTPCVSVCGSEDNIDTCDCDANGKVTVLCVGTPQIVEDTENSAGTQLTTTSTTFLAVCLGLLAGLWM